MRITTHGERKRRIPNRKSKQFVTRLKLSGEKRKLPIRRINPSRRCKKDDKSEKKQPSIDDLPENVIYEIMTKLSLKVLCNFLEAYSRATLVHGVYTIWVRKQKIWDFVTQRVIEDFEDHRYCCLHWDENLSAYRRFKKSRKIKSRERINGLLKHNQSIIISHYNDFTNRRSARLKEKKAYLITNC